MARKGKDITMDFLTAALVQWLAAHPTYVPAAMVAGTLLNIVLKIALTPRWAAIVQSSPRLAAAAKLLKAWNIDLLGGLAQIAVIFTGNGPTPPSPPAIPSNDSTPKPPPPPPPVFPLAAAIMVVLCLLVSGCSWMQSPKFVKFVADTEVAQDSARNAITQAAIAFEASIKLVPADAQAKARVRFDQAILAYTKADQAMTSLRKSALATQESPVDVAKVVRNLVDAVSVVISIADVFGGPDAGAFGAPSGFEPPAALTEARKSVASIEVPQ